MTDLHFKDVQELLAKECEVGVCLPVDWYKNIDHTKILGWNVEMQISSYNFTSVRTIHKLDKFCS